VAEAEGCVCGGRILVEGPFELIWIDGFIFAVAVTNGQVDNNKAGRRSDEFTR
jgi:hypothetical protein